MNNNQPETDQRESSSSPVLPFAVGVAAGYLLKKQPLPQSTDPPVIIDPGDPPTPTTIQLKLGHNKLRLTETQLKKLIFGEEETYRMSFDTWFMLCIAPRVYHWAEIQRIARAPANNVTYIIATDAVRQDLTYQPIKYVKNTLMATIEYSQGLSSYSLTAATANKLDTDWRNLGQMAGALNAEQQTYFLNRWLVEINNYLQSNSTYAPIENGPPATIAEMLIKQSDSLDNSIYTVLYQKAILVNTILGATRYLATFYSYLQGIKCYFCTNAPQGSYISAVDGSPGSMWGGNNASYFMHIVSEYDKANPWPA